MRLRSFRFRLMQRCAAASLLLAGAACTSTFPAPAAGVPELLRPPATEVLLATYAAQGVQIYECRAAAAGRMEWSLLAPEAELFDDLGRRVAHHYAGPTWESLDGSKVTGSVAARTASPRPDAIAWLLLTGSASGRGAFEKVTSIQRVNTRGGTAPNADTCTPATAGQQARIRYAADYAFYRSR